MTYPTTASILKLEIVKNIFSKGVENKPVSFCQGVELLSRQIRVLEA